MDWRMAIEANREALKRVLAMLVAMAGLAAGPHPEVRADGEPGRTLPRHLHRAVLRLLRPAESAARRLIIAAARGLVVPPPRRRRPHPKPATAELLLRRFGIAIVMSPADLAGSGAGAKRDAARPRSFSLPLFDPLRRPLSLSKGRRRYVPAHAAPRILFPGVTEPFALPPPPSPDDPISALRLGRRLTALASALDDLPGQAKRFARWKARRAAVAAAQKSAVRDAAVVQKRPAPGPFCRISPLRPGRPPGGRLSRYDPTATHPRKIREVDEILAHAHALAVYALAASDTS